MAFYRRRKAEPKPRPQRSYSDGYLSRTQIGQKLKLTGFSWHIVQKALTRAGLLAYDPTTRGAQPTEAGRALSRLHSEVTEQGAIKEWLTWSPAVIDIIREHVEWVLANPVGRKETEAKAPRSYPDGYMSIVTMATKLGRPSLDLIQLLNEWEIAKRDENNKLLATDGGEYSLLHEETNAKGKVESWYVWSPALLEQFVIHYSRNESKGT